MVENQKDQRSAPNRPKGLFFSRLSSSMSLAVNKFVSFFRCSLSETSESSKSSIELMKKAEKSLVSDVVPSETASTATRVILTKSERFRHSFRKARFSGFGHSETSQRVYSRSRS